MESNVNSSNVEKVSWDNRILRIHFKNGKITAYQNVPEGMFFSVITATSVGSFIRLYIATEYNYMVEQNPIIESKLKDLEHHKDTTVGLWATDKPELIPESLKDMFFLIEYSHTCEHCGILTNESDDKCYKAPIK